MKIEIDKENLEGSIVKIQKAVDELVSANQEILGQAEKSNAVAKEYEKQNAELIKGALGMTETLKNLHIVLGSKKELWQEDAEMLIVMEELGKFVMGSGAIKMGVVTNDN